MNYAAMYQRAAELLSELKIEGINVAQPVMNYGGGHQQLIENAKALNKRAKLPILDEPSSSLTAAEIRILLDIVRDPKARGVAVRTSPRISSTKSRRYATLPRRYGTAGTSRTQPMKES